MRCILNYFQQLGRASDYNVQQLRKSEHVSMSEQHVSQSEGENVLEAGSDSAKDTPREERDVMDMGENTTQATSSTGNGTTPRMAMGSPRETAHQVSGVILILSFILFFSFLSFSCSFFFFFLTIW
jgi:hypothetical protein